jgi:sulfoxide reductase heme-binding subunit YedZ
LGVCAWWREQERRRQRAAAVPPIAPRVPFKGKVIPISPR